MCLPTIMRKSFLFAAFLILAAPIASPATIDQAKVLKSADASTERAMRELRVPGVAIGIIQDGKAIVAKGYGVRQLGKSAPVSADTVSRCVQIE